ncbi:hypothetical protein [Erwinia sp. ErVv1]|uniref:hypothetical protein n=1 Tax=Erwinia sp. ErVv1 TaxID=1603299 RepID=UPI00082A7E9B|nr:hypothetical protein [Erwinia sp. ErVv1]
MFVIFCFLLIPNFCTAQQEIDIPDARPFQINPTLKIDGETLFFDGLITRASQKEVIKLLTHNDIKTLSVNSMGGDVQSALDIANILYTRKINIAVRTVCASACANYLFPAGQEKIIGNNSYLLWHGSAGSPAEQLRITTDSKTLSPGDLVKMPEFVRIKKREKNFYSLLKVNYKLPFCPQLQDNYSVKFPEKWFSYTPEDMRKFGIRNIFYVNSASQWVISMRNKHVIFASYCK